MDSQVLSDLAGFLTPTTRADVRVFALKNLTGISSSDQIVEVFQYSDGLLLKNLLQLFKWDHLSVPEKCLVLKILVNSSSHPEISDAICDHISELCSLMESDLDPSSEHFKLTAQLLSNLTLQIRNCEKIMSIMDVYKFVQSSIEALTKTDQTAPELIFLGYVARNFSQVKPVRDFIVQQCASKFFSLIKRSEQSDRKEIAIDIIRNCAMDPDWHDILIEKEEFLVSLLLPLIGPENLDEAENKDLPLDLQYMESDKQREPDPKLRLKLLETLYQICTSSAGRQYLRNNGTYYVLRELHKWETDPSAAKLCGNVIGVMIRSEEDMGCHNLREIELTH